MTGACHNLQIITLVIPIDLSAVFLISGKNIVPGTMVEGLESALVASFFSEKSQSSLISKGFFKLESLDTHTHTRAHEWVGFSPRESPGERGEAGSILT